MKKQADNRENRTETGDVVALCCMCALNHRFGIGESRLQRVADAAGTVADRFAQSKTKFGWLTAKKRLAEEIKDVFGGDFVLPVIVAPKKRREWDRLGEKRDVANVVVKFYIRAAQEVLGFGKGRTEAFVQQVEQEYRAFGEWAKDGDYYGYQRLARELSAIFREEVTVDDSEAREPIFGRTID